AAATAVRRAGPSCSPPAISRIAAILYIPSPRDETRHTRMNALARTGPLRTRTIWTLAGAAWGLLVGLVTAVQTAAFLAGVGWLFIFGDDPWPEAANWVLLGMTLVAGVVPFVLLAWLGRRLGIAFESESRQRLRTRRR